MTNKKERKKSNLKKVFKMSLRPQLSIYDEICYLAKSSGPTSEPF